MPLAISRAALAAIAFVSAALACGGNLASTPSSASDAGAVVCEPTEPLYQCEAGMPKAGACAPGAGELDASPDASYPVGCWLKFPPIKEGNACDYNPDCQCRLSDQGNPIWFCYK